MTQISEKSTVSRRVVLKAGAAVTGWGFLPRAKSLLAQTPSEPHFFLQLYFQDSLDSSYLFDARPLAFTAAGKIQNYLGQDPSLWMGSNGGKALATSLTADLKAYKDQFTVINGVHMATSFDGHEQNRNILLTGNPFGGESYLPHLNETSSSPTPLDYLQVGRMYGIEITNAASSVILEPSSAASFSTTIQSDRDLKGNDPVVAFLQGRMGGLAKGTGRFSEGSRRMLLGMEKSFGLAEKIKSADITLATGDKDLQKALKVAHQYFIKGIAKAALITIDDKDLDTHGPKDAAKQPELYKSVVADINTVFTYLKSTPFDESRGLSLLDVTTVVIASEFGRTNYQEGKAMDQTGTDHDPLSNLFIMGGKGIKGGQVIGASDLDELDGNGSYRGVSGAHHKLDGKLLKRMGKPFNFDTMQPAKDTPEDYDGDHYITIASVVNTVYKLFGTSPSHDWKNNRNGVPAKMLAGLMA